MKNFFILFILWAASIKLLAQSPIAVEDEIFTFDNVSATGSLASNDINPSGLPLTYTLISTINYGMLTVQPNGNWTFVPGPTTSALNDIIYYQVCTGTGLCSVGTIYLYVQFHNNTPEANNDLFYVEANSTLSGNVGTNDYDADYLTDPISTQNNFSATTLPAVGTLNLSLNGSFTYSPPAGFTGTVTFNYLNCDACTTCDNATVTIQVVPSNASPTANASSINVVEDTPFNGTLAGLASDPENDALTYSATSQPLYGSLVMMANGSYTYAPYNNYYGADAFSYQACDFLNQCASATISVTVANTNDAPSLGNDSYTLNEDQQGFTGSVNTNDTDDFSSISYTIATNPIYGQINLLTNGNFVYTPNANYNGLDNAVIQGCDAQGLCSLSSLFLSITPVNDTPVAVLDDVYGYEDTPLNGTVANDTDADGDMLTYTLWTAPSSGNLTISNNGTFTYTPASNFAGIVSGSYTVCDPSGACSNGTLQIEIIEINDDPIIVSDSYTGQEDQIISGNLRT
ncbi:MAG: Ig-like domain-containing protein, partial [Flavobacteriales bacterium]